MKGILQSLLSEGILIRLRSFSGSCFGWIGCGITVITDFGLCCTSSFWYRCFSLVSKRRNGGSKLLTRCSFSSAVLHRWPSLAGWRSFGHSGFFCLVGLCCLWGSRFRSWASLARYTSFRTYSFECLSPYFAQGWGGCLAVFSARIGERFGIHPTFLGISYELGYI